MRITVNRAELHRRITDIAYVVADVASEPGNAHRLHQTFDICEGENLERTDDLITLAFYEAVSALSPLVAATRDSLTIEFHDKSVSTPQALRIKECVREFLICRTLQGWLSVTLPDAEPLWETNADRQLASLKSSARRIRPFRRAIPPI